MFFVYLFIALNFIHFANSQENKNFKQAILKGTVIDDENNLVNLDLQFENSKKKKFKITTKAGTGEYEQVVDVNEDYIVTPLNPEILREEFKVHINMPDKDFNPQRKDFKVKKLKAGKVLYKENLFTGNTTELNAQGKEFIETLKTTIKFNRSISVKIEISGANKDLVAKRVDYLNNLVADSKAFTRKASFVANPTKEKDDIDFVVIIQAVEDTLK